jgi:predicted XRE-type DNA-binding protein
LHESWPGSEEENAESRIYAEFPERVQRPEPSRADDLLAKAELAAKIIAEIQRRRLTQTEAAELLAIDQPEVSRSDRES